MTRILIAEDRVKMRTTLRSLFELYSKWDICGEAEDGQQAVDAAAALRPDVVLLDYKMPKRDGIDAATEIKKRLPETPIVIFTLYKNSELESEARKAGVRAVVGKEEGVIKLLRTNRGSTYSLIGATRADLSFNLLRGPYTSCRRLFAGLEFLFTPNEISLADACPSRWSG